MIQTPADLQTEINDLCKKNPVLKDDKLTFRMKSIDIMKRFYEEKAPEAPEGQAIMFKHFVVALVYAADIIRRHRKLTERLSELAEGEKDVTESI